MFPDMLQVHFLSRQRAVENLWNAESRKAGDDLEPMITRSRPARKKLQPRLRKL